MIVLDTSVLIRFFTRDDDAKAGKAKSLLESSEDLLLIDAVLLELIFTLMKVYGLPKVQIVAVVKYLLSRPNIRVNLETRKAARRYEVENMSIADCLVMAYGEEGRIASFDDKLNKAGGVKSIWR